MVLVIVESMLISIIMALFSVMHFCIIVNRDSASHDDLLVYIKKYMKDVLSRKNILGKLIFILFWLSSTPAFILYIVIVSIAKYIPVLFQLLTDKREKKDE